MRDILSDFDQGEPRNPQTAAQEAMRPVLPKRFYKQVTIGEEGDDEDNISFSILLDGKAVKTPGRRLLELPTNAAAQIVADEWRAQEKTINPALMPATRLVNTACDGVRDDPQAVIEDMLKFAGSDLLCYRASAPTGLVEMQMKHWDPVLDWAGSELGAFFETTEGLVQIPQPKECVAAISTTLKQWPDPIAIAALHTFTNLTGSIILALAIAKNKLSAEEAWTIAHVDEDWNASTWGEDYEARKRLDNRWNVMQAASALFSAIEEH